MQCKNCIIKSKAVETLNMQELEYLNEHCAALLVDAGEYIIKQGNLSSQVAYIKSGLARIHMTGPGGKEQTLKIVTPGSYLGLQAMLAEKTHKYSASALKQSEICFIDNQSFNKLIRLNPAFAHELILYLSRDELSYFERFVSYVQKQINGRLADSLLIFREISGNANEFELPISKADFATLVGATREAVSRAIKELVNTGVIEIEGKKVTLKNPELLMRISRNG
jgi:CRP/FNR family transcriptional regulator